MGPSKPFAEEQAEQAYNEIMALLKEKYQIDNWSFPAPDENADTIQRAVYGMSRRNALEWDKKANDLKQALVELIWHQHCMDF